MKKIIKTKNVSNSNTKERKQQPIDPVMIERYRNAVIHLKELTDNPKPVSFSSGAFRKKHKLQDNFFQVCNSYGLINIIKPSNPGLMYSYLWVYEDLPLSEELARNIYSDCRDLQRRYWTEKKSDSRNASQNGKIQLKSSKEAALQVRVEKGEVRSLPIKLPTFTPAHLAIIGGVDFNVLNNVEIDSQIMLTRVGRMEFLVNQSKVILKAEILLKDDKSTQTVTLAYEGKGFTLQPNKQSNVYTIKSVPLPK